MIGHNLLLILAWTWRDDAFRKPLPLWNHWAWLVIPLVIGVAIVWKSVKCRLPRQIPLEAAVISFWILLLMSAAAALLSGIAWLVAR